MNNDNKTGLLPSGKENNEQIARLISENHSLMLQLKEVNELLEVKEEELVLLRQQQARVVEMRSLNDVKNLEIAALKQNILEEKQKATGAGKREKEVEAELDDALGIYTAYSNLKEQNTYSNIKLEDALSEIKELKERNRQLEYIADKVALLQSESKLAGEEKENK